MRTTGSRVEKESIEKREDKQEEPSKKAKKVEVAAKTIQYVPEVAVGERTSLGL